MKKIYTLGILVVGLIFLSQPASAITVPNFLSGVSNFNGLLCKIANGIGELVGSLGVLMLMIAGILYLTSAGSPEKVGTAKKALIYAIAGMVIGLASKPIVNTVMNIIHPGTTC